MQHVVVKIPCTVSQIARGRIGCLDYQLGPCQNPEVDLWETSPPGFTLTCALKITPIAALKWYHYSYLQSFKLSGLQVVIVRSAGCGGAIWEADWMLLWLTGSRMFPAVLHPVCMESAIIQGQEWVDMVDLLGMTIDLTLNGAMKSWQLLDRKQLFST